MNQLIEYACNVFMHASHNTHIWRRWKRWRRWWWWYVFVCKHKCINSYKDWIIREKYVAFSQRNWVSEWVSEWWSISFLKCSVMLMIKLKLLTYFHSKKKTISRVFFDHFIKVWKLYFYHSFNQRNWPLFHFLRIQRNEVGLKWMKHC